MSSYVPGFVWTLLGEFDAWSSARLADPSSHWALLWLLSLSLLQATGLTMFICALLIGTKRVLRWPVLVCIFLFMLAELCVYFAVRYIVFLLEKFVFLTSSALAARPLRRDMKDARSYAEWARLAAKADESLGTAAWKAEPYSRYFNGPLLQTLMDELRASREKHDVNRLTATLQTCLHKNCCGILNEQLYSKTLVGTKYLIDEYVREVIRALEYLELRAEQTRGAQRVPSSVAAAAAAAETCRASAASSGPNAAAAPSPFEIAPSRVSAAGRGSSRRAQSPAGGARARSTSRAGRKKQSQPQAAQAQPPVSNGSNGTANLHAHCAPAAPSVTSALDSAHLGPVLSLCDSASPAELLRFFLSAKRQFGATALCLSGGASIGNFHWGTVLALLEEGLLPRIISGTSSGAVVAATVGTRTDEELLAHLTVPMLNANLNSFEESWFPTCSLRFLRTRCMYDNNKWLQKLQWFANSPAIPHMTFAEAHARTGRVLSITCTSQRKHNPSLLLNYLTTPHVCIDSAILASAAVPGFIQPVVLMEKHPLTGAIRPFHDKDLQWCDGSLQRDLPLSELAEQFGANFFLVSQTNPHIIPWFFNSRGQSGTPSFAWRRRTGGYRGGFLLSALELWLKEDMKKNLRVLSELDLVPSILGSDFSFLFLQDFQGQVTMVPNASLRDFAKIISDPSASDLERFLREGRLMTYRKMSMIRNRMLIGHKLNECIERMAERMQEEEEEQSTTQHGHGMHRSRLARAAPVSPLHHTHGEGDPLAGLFPVSRSRHLHMDRTNETLE